MEIVQCRMARAALDWSLDDLERESRTMGSGVSRRTIAKFEAGEAVSDESVAALRATFEEAGVLFIEHGAFYGGVVPPMKERRDWRMVMTSTKRVLDSRGPVKLVETSNPTMGVEYSVWDRNLVIWSGQSRAEAQRHFEEALKTGPSAAMRG